MKNLSLFVLFLLCSTGSFAQQKQPYDPYMSEVPSEEIIDALHTQLEEDITKLPEKYREQYVEEYYERTQWIQSQIDDNYIVSHPVIDAYLTRILAEIYQHNPEIPKHKIRLLVSRHPSPNAVCYGEGTISIHLSLLRHLKNESQIAFILCHELAHYLENHVNHRIDERIEFLNSKELKEKVERLRNKEFNKRKEVLKLLKRISFDASKHSRHKESEADSIGLQLMVNTNYAIKEAATTMHLLDSIDALSHSRHSIDYKTLFDFVEYPFKDKWLEKEYNPFASIVIDDSLKTTQKDSLKTHPECSKRAETLSNSVEMNNKTNNNRQVFVQSKDAFVHIQFLCDFEFLEGMYQLKMYGLCLYHSLKALHKYPDNAYIYAMTGKCFNQLYLSQENYRRSEILDHSSPDFSDAYNEFLRFIHRLSNKDIANINFLFLQPQAKQHISNEDFLYAYYCAHHILGKTQHAQTLKAKYLQLFPDGRFAEEIKNQD